MTDHAATLAHSRGADIRATSAHRSRLLQPAHVSAADLVVTMTREHRREVVEIDPASLRKVFTAREFSYLLADAAEEDLLANAAPAADRESPQDRLAAALSFITQRRGMFPRVASADQDDVVDPYRRPLETYEKSAAQLDPSLRAIERVIRMVVRA